MFPKLTVTQVNYLNIGLMAVSAIMAMWLPFQTFLFVYAVLGPAHYLTEISWLHDKRYFTKRRYDYLLLVAAGILVTALYLLRDTGIPSQVGILILFVAFASALSFVLTDNLAKRIAAMAISAVAGFMLLEGTAFRSIFGVFLPTLIHVFIFTGLFILVGALKGRSFSGILSLAVFVAISCSFFILPHSASGEPSQYVKDTYGYMNDLGRFTEGFIGLNAHILQVFSLHEFGKPSVPFAAWVEGVNNFLYSDPLALAIMAFIAFAYMYHYLNWFSKTSIIQWHNIPRWRFVVVIAIWALSVGLYQVDYALGLNWLFFLSLTHVLLEFPLNHLTFINIGKEFRAIFSVSR